VQPRFAKQKMRATTRSRWRLSSFTWRCSTPFGCESLVQHAWGRPGRLLTPRRVFRRFTRVLVGRVLDHSIRRSREIRLLDGSAINTVLAITTKVGLALR